MRGREVVDRAENLEEVKEKLAEIIYKAYNSEYEYVKERLKRDLFLLF